MLTKIRIIPVFFVLQILLTSCYQSYDYSADTTGSRYDLEKTDRVKHSRLAQEVPEQGDASLSQSLQERMPWEIWTDGRDLAGQPLSLTQAYKGDAFVKEGQRARALEEYKQIKLGPLSDSARHAIVYRIASTELALDRPKKALAILGWYVERSKLKVEDIDPFTGLLLGYAYGRDNDYNQAFAWFSRANRLDAGQGGVSQSARSAVSLIARNILDENYDQLTNSWGNDLFIHQILGQEKLRRAKSGVKVNSQQGLPFWQDSQVAVTVAKDAGTIKPTKVLVLLPLTGQYGSLGQASKKGIELAFRGNGIDKSHSVEYRDTYGDRAQATAIVEEFAMQNQPGVILGPLLAPEAEIVAEIGRKKDIPVLALTKSNSFQTGDNIFRLGPSTKSIVDSLLESAYNIKGIREYAFVYPDDPQSKELIEEARTKLLSFGLAPVYEASYAPGNFDSFANIVKQIETQPMEAILMTDNILAATRFRFQMTDELRRGITMLGTAKWDVPEELKQSARALEGSMFVSPFFVFSDDYYTQQFQATFKSTYNTPPDFLSAQGFDAGTILANALKRSAESGDFVGALRNIDLYQGLTGEIAVQSNGELERRFKVVELSPTGIQPLGKADRPVLNGSSSIIKG